MFIDKALDIMLFVLMLELLIKEKGEEILSYTLYILRDFLQ